MPTEEFLKVLFIGDANVGKSNMILRYTQNVFCKDSIQTLGMEYLTKQIVVGETPITVEISDTGGQERFRSLTSSYYRYVDTIFAVFDTTDRKSFTNIPFWIDEVQTHASETAQIILVGNKIDSEHRIISTEEAEKIAKLYSVRYMETSAKYNLNIEELFSSTIEEILESRQFMTRCPSIYRNRSKKRRRSSSAKLIRTVMAAIGHKEGSTKSM